MLKRFAVTNFKNFKDTTIFDLGNPSNYEFNSMIVKNGIISKGIVLGINGSGKSNLALALFDIVLHLTDKEKTIDKYSPYLNLSSRRTTAEFEYTFCFGDSEVVYRYEKKNPMTLRYESLRINGKEVIAYDYIQKKGYTCLKGAETLQLSSSLAMDADKISRVKYIKNNSILQDNAENRAFIDFMQFVDHMLMFYSLDERRYQGFRLGADSFTQGIIRENKMQEFEAFLKEQGVEYSLVDVERNGQHELYCQYSNGTVPFMLVASTGTKSLALFYYWYIILSKASFVYIDEFDAFYHFELSQILVELIKKIPDTQVFLSSHNTDLLSNDILRPDAYFEITRNAIKSFDQRTEKELRRAHNIQKMYKAGAFDG